MMITLTKCLLYIGYCPKYVKELFIIALKPHESHTNFISMLQLKKWRLLEVD